MSSFEHQVMTTAQSSIPVPHSIGLAVFDGREVPVFVTELSMTRARIRGIGAAMLPDRFRLLVAAEHVDAVCIVTGRRGNLYGVRFEQISVNE